MELLSSPKATSRARTRRSQATGFGLMILLARSAAAIAPEAPEPRLAYLDPGTGSLILQEVIASVAGAAVVLRSYRRRILAFFGRGPRSPEPQPRDASPDE